MIAPLTDGPQVMPPLSPGRVRGAPRFYRGERRACASDLARTGNLLDGNNRIAIARELGLPDPPSVVLRGPTDEVTRRTEARRLNCVRRHLSAEQRRQVIRDQLLDTPDWADRRIGRVVGANHETVAAVRSELEATGEIRQLTALEGADGKVRPARRPVVLVKNRRELAGVVRDLPSALPLLPATVTDARTVKKAAGQALYRRQGAEAEDTTTIGTATLLLGDFLERGAEIADASVDLGAL